jgi:hypothetical protein
MREDAPGAQSWQHYTFDCRLRVCYVYDPSYINESGLGAPLAPGAAIPPGLATQSLNANGYSRFGQHLFLATAAELVGNAQNGFRSRANWINWPLPAGPVQHANVTVFVGGGRNALDLDECRRMCCVWVQQVAWLSEQLSIAIRNFRRNPTQQTEQSFRNAEYEWQQFFEGYTPLRG